MAQEYTKVAQTDEVPPGSMKQVEVGGDPVALINVDGEFYAIGGECTHAGGLLSEGILEGHQVECPLHGGIFNVKTGDAESPPPSTFTWYTGTFSSGGGDSASPVLTLKVPP